MGILTQRIQMGTLAQRITTIVFCVLTGAVAILRIFNATDFVLLALQLFLSGTMLGALVVLFVGPKKRA
jgi:hypothetical protein